MKILDRTLRHNDLYVEGFAVLLTVIGLVEPLCLIILGFYLYWQRKTIRWPFLAILCACIGVRFVLFQMHQNVSLIQDTVKVVDIDHYETSSRLTVRYLSHRYHVYVYQDDIALGDWIYLNGEVKTYEDATIPYGFNPRLYYLSHNVIGKIEIIDLSVVRNGYHIFSFRETLNNKVKTEHQSFVKSFVFGKDYLDDEMSDAFRQANLLFLMQTTGLHAYVLVLIIKKFMFYIDVDEHTQDIVVIGIYGVLCYLGGFTIGVTRLLLTQIFRWVNQKFKLRWTPLDRLFIVCFIMILMFIQWIYSVGFLMTIIILLTMELARDRYQSLNGYLKQLIISLLIAVSCLPFTGVLNPIVILCLPLFIMFITGLLYPLSFIACFTTRIDALLGNLLNALTWFTNLINDYQLTFYLPALNRWQILLYYAGFIYVLRAYQKHQLLLRTILLSSLFGFKIMNYRYGDDASVYFLDVGQGDTTYIETSSCQVMIDSFDGSNDFLKNHGVNQLDVLFLTHSDEDHTKEAINIINDIGVDQVIINPYDQSYETYQAKVSLGYPNQNVMCGELVFRILGPLHAYDEANANSLVIAVTIQSDKYLFTGDINEDVETDLINYYGDILNCDILKIAHHGSDTSSSERFINTVSPTHAIIFAGRDNRYHFPHQSVLDTLTSFGVIIHRTDQSGTIEIHYKKAERLWETTLPISNDFLYNITK